MGVVLTRVNTTLCGYSLANTVLEEENGKIVPSSDPNERERRNEMLADIENFLMSNLERKSDLTIVLECLEIIRKLWLEKVYVTRLVDTSLTFLMFFFQMKT